MKATLDLYKNTFLDKMISESLKQGSTFHPGSILYGIASEVDWGQLK